MSHQPRLLPDYGATPTPRERATARRENRAAQLDMFAAAGTEPTPPATCEVCGGEHAQRDCKHGTAPSLLDMPGITIAHVGRTGTVTVIAETRHVDISKPAPTCDMRRDCTKPIAMIDVKGYLYCAGHGVDRGNGGTPCRKLTPGELRKVLAGQPIPRY